MSKELPRLLTSEQFLALEPNKRLLAVKEHIEFAPEHHDQSTWVFRAVDNRVWCHTTACIAGWACFLAGETDPSTHGGWDYPYAERGQALLGLTNQQRTDLFGCPTSMASAAIDKVVAENSD